MSFPNNLCNIARSIQLSKNIIGGGGLGLTCEKRRYNQSCLSTRIGMMNGRGWLIKASLPRLCRIILLGSCLFGGWKVLSGETNAPAGPHQRYGVIINGDTSPWHLYNVRCARFVLLLHDYPGSNIYTLSQGFTAPNRFEFFGVMRDLAKVVKSNDTVVIYTTGHGGRDHTGCSYADLGVNGGISSRELVESLRWLHNPNLIYVGDQCYSGEFLSALAGAGFKCVAATDADETHEASCVRFAGNFWRAARGYVVDPQMDRNFATHLVTNRIETVKGAFDYAAAANKREGRADFERWLFYASPGRENFGFGD